MVIQNKFDVESPSTCSDALAAQFKIKRVPIDPIFEKANLSNIRYLLDTVAVNVEASSSLSRWNQMRLVLALVRKSFCATDSESDVLKQAENLYFAHNIEEPSGGNAGILQSSMSESESTNEKNLVESTNAMEIDESDNNRKNSKERSIAPKTGYEQFGRASTSYPCLKFPKTFFDIHIGYWLNEGRIYYINHVLSCCPAAMESLMGAIQFETLLDEKERTDSSTQKPQKKEKLPYTKNHKMLSFDAYLSTLVVDHLVDELVAFLQKADSTRKTAANSDATLMKFYREWHSRAQLLMRHLQDLLSRCYLYSQEMKSSIGGDQPGASGAGAMGAKTMDPNASALSPASQKQQAVK